MARITLHYRDLESAFDFVSAAAPNEHAAYIALDDGRIHWVSEHGEIDEPVPDDLDQEGRYIEVPHKYDLDLGNRLALRFAEAFFPEHHDEVDGLFRRKGAYARFKQWLEEEAELEQWYRFEAESTRRALLEWCEENDIAVVGSDPE